MSVAYVTSTTFNANGLNANILVSGSVFATAPVTFSFTAQAGDFLIYGDMNDNGANVETEGAALITDDGGNVWNHFLLSPLIAGNVLWYVILSNPITQINVTWHRSGSGTVNVPIIIIGRYTGVTNPQLTQVDLTSVAEVHSTQASSQQIGFALVGGGGSAHFTGPDIGGITRQFGQEPNISGSLISLVDSLSSDTVSQTTNLSVANFSFHGLFQASITTGDITIEKATLPSGSSQVFTFIPSYGGAFTLTDGNSNNSGPLAPGTYSVVETPVVGWNTTTSSDPLNIVVTAGNTTTVTFTNTLTATAGNIIVTKATNPGGSGQVFTFHPSWSGSPFTLTDGNSHDSGLIAPGTYSVSEDAVANWSTSTSSDPTNLVVTAGNTTHITFTNTHIDTTGNIVVHKVTSPGGSPQSFTFHPSWGTQFTLTDGGSRDSGQLTAGTYSVTEDPVTNWTTTTDINPNTIAVVVNQTTNVTFTNTFVPPIPPPPGPCPGKAIKPLTQVDTWELDHGFSTWPADRGVPYAWHENTLPQQTVAVAPTPDNDGTIELLYVALAQAMTGLGVNLAVPDDWAPYIVWGTLAELLSSDGPAFDPVRAEYCSRRFQEGIELVRLVLGG